jgi:hypothetical protein
MIHLIHHLVHSHLVHSHFVHSPVTACQQSQQTTNTSIPPTINMKFTLATIATIAAFAAVMA